MPLNSVLNRQLLATFRARLNTWKDAVNTLVTDVDAVEADVATLQGEMLAAQSDILSKQEEFARDTTNHNYRATAISITCLSSDYDTVIHVTNAGATNFTLPAPSSLAAFNVGTHVILYNDTTSLGAVTVVPSGSTYLGSTTIGTGEAAYIIKISTTTWLRLPLIR